MLYTYKKVLDQLSAEVPLVLCDQKKSLVGLPFPVQRDYLHLVRSDIRKARRFWTYVKSHSCNYPAMKLNANKLSNFAAILLQHADEDKEVFVIMAFVNALMAHTLNRNELHVPLRVPSVSCLEEMDVVAGSFKLMEMAFKTPMHISVAHLAFDLLNNLGNPSYDFYVLLAAGKCNCPDTQSKIKYEAFHLFAAHLRHQFEEGLFRDAFLMSFLQAYQKDRFEV